MYVPITSNSWSSRSSFACTATIRPSCIVRALFRSTTTSLGSHAMITPRVVMPVSTSQVPGVPTPSSPSARRWRITSCISSSLHRMSDSTARCIGPHSIVSITVRSFAVVCDLSAPSTSGVALDAAFHSTWSPHTFAAISISAPRRLTVFFPYRVRLHARCTALRACAVPGPGCGWMSPHRAKNWRCHRCCRSAEGPRACCASLALGGATTRPARRTGRALPPSIASDWRRCCLRRSLRSSAVWRRRATRHRIAGGVGRVWWCEWSQGRATAAARTYVRTKHAATRRRAPAPFISSGASNAR